MGATKLPAQDVYVGSNKVINSNGTLEPTVAVENNSITVAKLADNAVETAKIRDANVTAAKLAENAVETEKIKDSNVTLAKLATSAKTHILNYQVEDLAAGANVEDRVIFSVPTGLKITLVSVSMVAQGAANNIDDDNKCVIELSNGENTIVEKKFDADPLFPAAGIKTDLEPLAEDYKVLNAGEKIYLSVTNGSTADPPAFMLQIVYTVADAT